MIKRASDMVRDLRQNMRGGQGDVEIIHLFQPGEYKGGARLVARIILQPGCSIGMHEHVGEEEIYYVESGQAVLTDSTLADEVVMQAGDAALTLSGQSHAIRNDATETLKLLAIVLLNK